MRVLLFKIAAHSLPYCQLYFLSIFYCTTHVSLFNGQNILVIIHTLPPLATYLSMYLSFIHAEMASVPIKKRTNLYYSKVSNFSRTVISFPRVYVNFCAINLQCLVTIYLVISSVFASARDRCLFWLIGAHLLIHSWF